MDVSSVSSTAVAATSLALGGNPKALRNLPESEQLKAVAGQFESILLRQFLQDSVGKIMGSGPAGNVYGYMLTDVLAAKLSEGGGMGFAGIVQQQLAPRVSAAPAKEESP